MIAPADDSLRHAPESSERDWFDRFWMNAHSMDGRVAVAQGIGVYANTGVVDGFAIVVRGREQRIVRASREGGDASRLSVGPIAAEIVEPLRRWRFSLDSTNDSGIAYDLEFHATFEPIDCGRMRDWSHFVQAGIAAGRLVIDGEEIAIDPASWRAGRDRSWGLRPEGKGRFNWVCAQLPSLHLWYLTVEDQRGQQRFAQGWLRHGAERGGAVEELKRIERRPVFCADGSFATADVGIETAGGTKRTIEFRRLASTAFMRGGLYGGWQGLRQGQPRGPLVVESERWDLSDPSMLAEAAGLNDHVCEVTDNNGRETGIGIFELNHGK
jgi:hypothetical protein